MTKREFCILDYVIDRVIGYKAACAICGFEVSLNTFNTDRERDSKIHMEQKHSFVVDWNKSKCNTKTPHAHKHLSRKERKEWKGDNFFHLYDKRRVIR